MCDADELKENIKLIAAREGLKEKDIDVETFRFWWKMRTEFGCGSSSLATYTNYVKDSEKYRDAIRTEEQNIRDKIKSEHRLKLMHSRGGQDT